MRTPKPGERQRDADYSGFQQKGKSGALTHGLENYTQSFAKTFKSDRDQAKTFMLNRMTNKKSPERQKDNNQLKTPISKQRRVHTTDTSDFGPKVASREGLSRAD